MPASESGTNVKSALRTLDVLELVSSQRRPMTANEIAGALGIPLSSLSYLLSTLVDRDYLLRLGRQYSTGPALMRLAPRPEEPTLAEQAAPVVRMIHSELNETVSFFIRRGFEIEALASEEGQHPLRFIVNQGEHAPLHSFAAGKAVMAYLPDADFETYLRTSKRPAFTSKTLLSDADLRRERADIRKSGVARAEEEHVSGIVAIARPCLAGDAVVGAFSVAIPIVRYDADVDLKTTRVLKRAVNRLATHLAKPGRQG